MARARKTIDISDLPELLRIVEEVRASEEPYVLQWENEDVAVLMPVAPAGKRRRKRERTQAEYEAFRSAAGGWSDVDIDKFIEQIYADRRRGDRPPVKL